MVVQIVNLKDNKRIKISFFSLFYWKIHSTHVNIKCLSKGLDGKKNIDQYNTGIVLPEVNSQYDSSQFQRENN